MFAISFIKKLALAVIIACAVSLANIPQASGQTKVNLQTQVQGILPQANGGTGATSIITCSGTPAIGDILYITGATTCALLAAGSSGDFLQTNGVGLAPSWATVSTTPALSSITAATGANSISSGDNAQTWNWTLTTAAKTAFKIGEASASTNGAGNQYLFAVDTLANSTARPFALSARGNALIFATSDGDTSITACPGSGACKATTGGIVTITGGSGSIGANAGGAVNIVGGSGGSTSGNGGAVSMTGGAGNVLGSGGTGGSASIAGGAAVGSNAGGAVSLTSGAGGSTGGNSGAITLTTGTAASGASGLISLATSNAGSGSTGRIELVTGNATAGNAAGAINLTPGRGGSTGTGGAISLTSGNGGSTSGVSGTVTIGTGTTTNGNTGSVTIQSANASGAGNNNSGSVTIKTGSKTNSGVVGNIDLSVDSNATVLRINGTSQHFSTLGTVPSITADCGTSPSVAGTDQAMSITVGSGGTDTSCTVTFAKAFTNAPVCVANHEGALLLVRAVSTTTTVTIDAATPLTASGLLKVICSSYE